MRPPGSRLCVIPLLREWVGDHCPREHTDRSSKTRFPSPVPNRGERDDQPMVFPGAILHSANQTPRALTAKLNVLSQEAR
jgi:hypothetical protein